MNNSAIYDEYALAAQRRDARETAEKRELANREIAFLRENLAVARRERDELSRGLAAAQNRERSLELALERANDAAWHARWDARCWLTGFVLVNLFAAAYAAMVILSR